MTNPYHRRRRTARIEQKSVLAELVAGGLTVAAASRHMGISQQNGSLLWRDIKAGLGDQAR